MYRCNQCGHYCVPGYLECACRTTSHQTNLQNSPAAAHHPPDQAAAIPPRIVEKLALQAISAPRPAPSTDDVALSGKKLIGQLGQGANGG